LQGFHQIYGQLRCAYTFLANLTYCYNATRLQLHFTAAHTSCS
jgi:hypothetical protein